MLKLVLLGAAFAALAIGAKYGQLGAPAPKQVTAAELSAHTGAVTTLTVAGTVVDRKGASGGVTFGVKDAQGYDVTVMITSEARPPAIRIGGRYQFTGQTMGQGALSVTTPGSIRALPSSVGFTRYAELTVKDQFALMRSSLGTAKIAAPGVSDGTHFLELVTREDGKTWAQLP